MNRTRPALRLEEEGPSLPCVSPTQHWSHALRAGISISIGNPEGKYPDHCDAGTLTAFFSDAPGGIDLLAAIM